MIPKWLSVYRVGGRLDHLRKTKTGYIADSYHLDVDWFVDFLPIAYKKGYTVSIDGYSKHHEACMQITIDKRLDDNPISFYLWLRQFGNDNTDIGNLSREILNHRDVKNSIINSTSYESIIYHLRFYFLRGKILDTFEIAFKEYKKSILDKSELVKNRGHVND